MTHVWHLLGRKLSGEASLDELRELEQLLREDPELAYQVEIYSKYFESRSKRSARTTVEKLQSWERFKEKARTESPGDFQIPTIDNPFEEAPKRGSRKLLLSVFLLLVVGTISWFTWLRPAPAVPLAESTMAWKELNTLPGKRSKMTLPDGTSVWLNSDSRITYNVDFGKTKREITLTGEAFFDVAHNPEVPMLVKVRNVNIRVKGTAFNVKAYPENTGVETSLIRGLVELSTDSDPDRRILLKPNEKITIQANRDDEQDQKQSNEKKQPGRDFYRIDQLQESPQVNIIPEISWVENKLVFDNESFGVIADKLSKWYDVSIVVENEKLRNTQFSFVLRGEDVRQTLEALQLVHAFHFEIKGRTVFIK